MYYTYISLKRRSSIHYVCKYFEMPEKCRNSLRRCPVMADEISHEFPVPRKIEVGRAQNI
jgi:hypothetical protein